MTTSSYSTYAFVSDWAVTYNNDEDDHDDDCHHDDQDNDDDHDEYDDDDDNNIDYDDCITEYCNVM